MNAQRRTAIAHRASLLVLLAVAGCAGSAERSTIDPYAPVPEQWTAHPAGLTPLEETSSAWWEPFDDPQLGTLIEEALAAHPDLRAAAARVVAASAALDAAGALRWPEVNASLSANRQRQNFIGIPIPGSGDVLSSTTTSLGASLTAQWEVDLWGRLGAGERAAAGNLAATLAEEQALRLSLSGQVAIAWFQLVESARQVELASTIVDRWRVAEERVEARVREGIRTTLDLRLTRTERAGAEAERVVAERRLAAARRGLELLLGRYPAEEIAAADALPPLATEIPVGIPARTLARRPDLVAARARLASATAEVDRAEADLWPRLTLTGSGGRLSEELSDLLDGDFSVWSLGAGLVAPLFDRGRRRAAVEGADARRLEAEARFASAVLSACAEVEAALRDETLLAEQEARLDIFVDESLSARRLAREQFSAGLVDILDLLNAERNAAAAEARAIAVERARLENRVRLHVALGGSIPSAAPDPTTQDPNPDSAPSNRGEESAP